MIFKRRSRGFDKRKGGGLRSKFFVFHLLVVFVLILSFCFYFFYFNDEESVFFLSAELRNFSVKIVDNLSFVVDSMSYVDEKNSLRNLRGDVYVENFNGFLRVLNESFVLEGRSDFIRLGDSVINNSDNFRIEFEDTKIPMSLEILDLRVFGGEVFVDGLELSFEDELSVFVENFVGDFGVDERFFLRGEISSGEFVNGRFDIKFVRNLSELSS